MAKSKIPQSSIARATRLLVSGAKMAAREVSGRLGSKIFADGNSELYSLGTKIKQTQDLVDALSQLKGAAMKAGQLLSLEFSDLLPPEVVQILRSLHDSSTSMDSDQVRYIVMRELGGDRFSQMEGFTSQPIAAASIGQVHKAVLHGKPIAVKIQFPGVASTIDSDLNTLKRFAKTWTQLRGKDINFDDFFEELATSLKLESDYLHEAKNVDLYRSKVGGGSFVVPTVYHEYTTQKVLTLSFEEGIRINDWIKSKPSPEEATNFGQMLISLLIDEFFTFGVVQTDPNYGNFLYRPSTRQLVLLDFGATIHYEPTFRQEIQALFKVMAQKDHKALVQKIIDYGFVDTRESTEVIELLVAMLEHVVLIFAVESQPFRFNDDSYLKTIRETSFKFVSKVQYSPPAKRLALLNRKLGGVFHLLKDLEVSMDMRPFIDRVLNAPINP